MTESSTDLIKKCCNLISGLSKSIKNGKQREIEYKEYINNLHKEQQMLIWDKIGDFVLDNAKMYIWETEPLCDDIKLRFDTKNYQYVWGVKDDEAVEISKVKIKDIYGNCTFSENT